MVKHIGLGRRGFMLSHNNQLKTYKYASLLVFVLLLILDISGWHYKPLQTCNSVCMSVFNVLADIKYQRQYYKPSQNL